MCIELKNWKLSRYRTLQLSNEQLTTTAKSGERTFDIQWNTIAPLCENYKKYVQWFDAQIKHILNRYLRNSIVNVSCVWFLYRFPTLNTKIFLSKVFLQTSTWFVWLEKMNEYKQHEWSNYANGATAQMEQ